MIEGSRFGPYTLIKRVGYGGMAEIYLASTQGIGGFEKLLALKVLHARFAQDQDFVDMLIDEAKIAVQLTHINICQVFDLGCVDDRYYIAMEFVDGRDLYQMMVRNAEDNVDVPFDIAAFIGREVAAGLHYAHNKTDRYRRPMNLVHRDVSPQNVLISFDGQVKLVDFGIAKATARKQQTESGVIKGKFFYMSPEQAWGDDLDGRSDVFSCGICLYEMVAGEMLYNEDQPMVLLDRVRNAKITPLREKRPDVPRELERIINKALAKNREDRHPSAAVLQAELSSFLYGQWPGFGRHSVGEFIQNSFNERGFFMELPEELSADQKVLADDESIMRHDEFERAFEHSVIFALDEDIVSQDSFESEIETDGSIDETKEGASETADQSANKTTDVPSWADEGERTELLDGEIFSEMSEINSTSENESQDMESADEDTLLFVTPLLAEPARLKPKPNRGTTVPEFDVSATAESQIPEPKTTPEPGAAARVGRDDATLNERVPNSALSMDEPIKDFGLDTPPVIKKMDQFVSPPKESRANTSGKKPRKTDSLKREHIEGGFKLKRRTILSRWARAPGFYVTICVLGLLTYGATRILPDLLEDPTNSVTLVLESIPNGAKIFLDGEDTGRTTRSEFEGLTNGETREVKLTLPGHEPMTSKIELTGPSGENGIVRIYRTIKLVPEKRQLTIYSNPPGAELKVDGVFVGKTPQTLNGIENRIGPLEFSLRKEGFQTVTETRDWPKGKDGKITIQLKPR